MIASLDRNTVCISLTSLSSWFAGNEYSDSSRLLLTSKKLMGFLHQLWRFNSRNRPLLCYLGKYEALNELLSYQSIWLAVRCETNSCLAVLKALVPWCFLNKHAMSVAYNVAIKDWRSNVTLFSGLQSLWSNVLRLKPSYSQNNHVLKHGILRISLQELLTNLRLYIIWTFFRLFCVLWLVCCMGRDEFKVHPPLAIRETCWVYLRNLEHEELDKFFKAIGYQCKASRICNVYELFFSYYLVIYHLGISP